MKVQNHMNEGAIDWEALDWDKSNIELSQQHQLPVAKVSAARLLFGRPRLGTSRFRHINWRELDWLHKNNSTLAIETGAPIQSVRHFRKRLGFPNCLNNRTDALLTMDRIKALDWVNKPDSELAQELGVSRERIRQIRLEGRYPECRYKHQHGPSLALGRWITAHKSELDGLTRKEAVAKLPIALSTPTATRWLRREGVQLRYGKPLSARTKLATDSINWDLTNGLISLIWEIGPAYRVAQLRYAFRKPMSKWRVYKDRVSGGSFDELVAAVGEELLKAIGQGVVKAASGHPALELLGSLKSGLDNSGSNGV